MAKRAHATPPISRGFPISRAIQMRVYSLVYRPSWGHMNAVCFLKDIRGTLFQFMKWKVPMGVFDRVSQTVRPVWWILVFSAGILLTTIPASAQGINAIPYTPDRKQEWERQFAELQKNLQDRDVLQAILPQTFHPASSIADTDRDPADTVLRRTRALFEDISQMTNSAEIDEFEKRLEELETACLQIPVSDHNKRFDLYLEACGLRRDVAFSNPLLNFDELLFIKRDRAGYEHMCDQFYGFNAQPGGGIFILKQPFDKNPQIVNLLENSTVESGRLAGKQLTGGSFLSPELTFDAKKLLFAYTELDPASEPWSEGKSFHLFQVTMDGTGLVQLTDGTWNDFDPCQMPNGRIAFISERRGGYLRCGARPCPTYTLHSMNPDGSDIVTLSYHETHEWHPSVNHDGMLVYTRWDYVDRDTNVAHHPWVTTPDGRDARAIHGNYPDKRQARPWMEMDIRAIPNSHQYVATAASHHGQAYGSLVIFDPSSDDDGAMSPIKRLTPEVGFPEAEKHRGKNRECELYATPWPLSEKYHLCVYESGNANYGIYLLDAFGNRELIYRDPEIACLSPIPLQARPMPPVLPQHSAIGLPPGMSAPQKTKQSTIALQSVYDTRIPFPQGTEIKALRIIQVLPKTTPSNNIPRIGVAEQTNARAVLGTVPVEADGSAYFEAPAQTPFYFQALDERGLAVQSMRSLTYLQPGEQLVCQGCHEPRKRSPNPQQTVALAFQRPASIITEDVDGSNPFNYPRLVQPVLDKHCVNCHTKNAPKAPDLSGGGEGWSPSYRSLAEHYGFYFNVFNGSFNDPAPMGGSRTLPGQFGAIASPLFKMLEKGHKGIVLPEDDFHRLTLWLDCNSDFYGSYENIEAQSRGEIVLPTLE